MHEAISSQTLTITGSVKVKQSGQKEMVAWDDGTISVEHWRYQEQFDDALDHLRLTPEEARGLRNFLNSQVVTQLLGL